MFAAKAYVPVVVGVLMLLLSQFGISANLSHLDCFSSANRETPPSIFLTLAAKEMMCNKKIAFNFLPPITTINFILASPGYKAPFPARMPVRLLFPSINYLLLRRGVHVIDYSSRD